MAAAGACWQDHLGRSFCATSNSSDSLNLPGSADSALGRPTLVLDVLTGAVRRAGEREEVPFVCQYPNEGGEGRMHS